MPCELGDPPVDVEAPIGRRPPWLTELPLTPLQERWWVLCTRYPGGTAPIVAVVHRLRGPLVPEAWIRAAGAVVDRHESLRTRFRTVGGHPVQVVDPPTGLAVERVDLSHLPRPEAEARARALLNQRREAPLDLERGPLVDSCLVRLADDDHVWTMTMHHILGDGASLAVIDAELSVLYPAYAAGTEPDLPPLAVQYGDYAVWCAATRDAELEDEDRDYWRHRLSGVPALELRGDHPRPERKGAPADEVRRLLDRELTGRIDQLGRTLRGTRFMVLLAALQVLLAGHSGQDDFCVGIPVVGAGRTRAELAPLVGLFSNALALRCDLSGDLPFTALVATTRETMLDAIDHQEIAFGQVVEELRLPHDPGRAQVFQALLMFDEFDAGGGLELPGLRVEEFPLAMPKVLHDVMLYAWPCSDGLWTRFIYDTGLFAAPRMERMARRYEELLRAVVADPGRRVSELTAGWQ